MVGWAHAVAGDDAAFLQPLHACDHRCARDAELAQRRHTLRALVCSSASSRGRWCRVTGASAAERGAILRVVVAIGDKSVNTSLADYKLSQCYLHYVIFCAYQSSMPLPGISGFAHCNSLTA